jgi:hypothetical protein
MVELTSRLKNLFYARRVSVVAYGLLIVWFILLTFATLYLNDGRFIYTLDDPYIHLAMSEGIHAGGYGINPGEPASASSSILFPYLLAWASPYAFHEYLPFAINIAALAATIVLFRIFLTEIGLDRSRRCRIASTVFAAALPIVMNLIGLTFMGMEHSLQVLLETAIFLGLIRALDRRHIDPWLPAVLILAPLIRYESLLVSVLALFVLTWRGWWRISLFTGLTMAGIIVAYSYYLVTLGLSPLPNSVSAHSLIAHDAVTGSHVRAMILSVVAQFIVNLMEIRGPVLLVFAVVFGLVWLRAKKRNLPRDYRTIALFGLIACGAYLLFGKFTQLGRHEAAILVVAALILIYLWRQKLAEEIENRSYSRATFFIICLFSTIFAINLRREVLIPVASNNIYEQQYQMHRLAHDYIRGPVAVNDIGWVSYRNDWPVFDLWGLASTEALRARRAGLTPAILAQLVEHSHARLIMIYDDWFKSRPSGTWTLLARMRTSKPAIYAADDTVSLYAPAGADISDLRAKLKAFARGLPPGATLDLN